jgi:sugar phosphate isomerase/epimerase
VNRATHPKLALCNFFDDVKPMRDFALEHGFAGIDWSFDVHTLPEMPEEESAWLEQTSALEPLEVRYHCPFYRIDLGHHDPWEAKAAETIFHRIIRLVSKAGGQYLTVHIGLGRDSTEPLSWDKTIDSLARVVDHGWSEGVKICLENLAWGWTSRPDLFEKIIRKSGAGVTFDFGHAHACESIGSQQYTFEDFVTPHAGRLFNAHIYHTEVSGRGHIPPEQLEDIEERLNLLQNTGCDWWVLEVKDEQALLQTKQIVDTYLTRHGYNAIPSIGVSA